MRLGSPDDSREIGRSIGAISTAGYANDFNPNPTDRRMLPIIVYEPADYRDATVC